MSLKDLIPMNWRYRLTDMRGRGVYGDYADENRCVFIHIPKTAGTSVVKALFGSSSRHIPWEEFHRTNGRKFSDYYKFAFVRNPWDRLLSAYLFLKRGGMNPTDAAWAKECLGQYNDFESFVHEWVSVENIESWVHFIPQYKWIYDDQETLQMDYVGRMESIGEDFQTVAKRLGRNVELPVTML
ncbi:sulfotransferase family protein [Verrucomicrobiales bacterium]|nr:sulfotransferase family protein [Verrucomicrobiales bacterium]